MRSMLVASVLALGCAPGERPPPGTYQDHAPTDGGTSLIDSGGRACGEFCGETFLTEVTTPKNLYFVIDRSGSMAAPMPDSPFNRSETARGVLVNLLRTIGHRVSYGAAAFPTTANPDDCSPGGQVFPPARGQLPPCEGGDDPLLDDFRERLETLAPLGGTPTAATLRKLRPDLVALEGETTVVLVTDGAPNCNVDEVCGTDSCTHNIEGATLGGRVCDAAFNCCDPSIFGETAGAHCVDDDATEAAVLALAEDGIPTYVVGMPGAEPYADLLGRLAVAGGTARPEGVPYYATADSAQLRDALYAIGTGVAIRCSIELDAPPADPGLVNVYFDGEVVASDPENGWTWDGEATIVVTGEACERLESGSVLDARAVFGCDTVVR